MSGYPALPPDDPLRLFDGRGTEPKIGFKGDSLAEILDEIIDSWTLASRSDPDPITRDIEASVQHGHFDVAEPSELYTTPCVRNIAAKDPGVGLYEKVAMMSMPGRQAYLARTGKLP